MTGLPNLKKLTTVDSDTQTYKNYIHGVFVNIKWYISRILKCIFSQFIIKSYINKNDENLK